MPVVPHAPRTAALPKPALLSGSLGIALMMGLTPALAADAGLEQAVREARLEGQIGTAILLNRHLNPFEISVDVEGDTAILTGTVDEAVDRERAEQVARNAGGIARVDNRIAVEADAAPRQRAAQADHDHRDGPALAPLAATLPEGPSRDAWISARVKASLLMSPAVDGLQLQVSTQDGRVTLDGRAGSAAERDLAVDIAKDIKGVAGVDATGVRIGAAAGLADTDPDD